MDISEHIDVTANRRTIQPGDVIFVEGQNADCAFVILQGDVQVSVNDAHGHLITLNDMKAGSILGELALLRKDSRRTATAMSKHGCELVVIDKAIFDSRMADADPFLRYVIAHLCKLILMWTDRVRAA